MPLHPQFVEELYIATFEFREESNAPTDMSRSRILRLTGNRQQDYDMARFVLAEVFPDFLAIQPERATRAVVAAIRARARDRGSIHGDETVQTFPFGARTARFLQDYSSIWDAQVGEAHENAVRMLETFTDHCDKLAGSPNGLESFRKILSVIVENNELAVMWRRLLQLGAKYPLTVGREIFALATALPILTSMDTMEPVVEYLKSYFPLLDISERENIERTILTIPDHVPNEHKRGEAIRDRLPGCLSPQDLVTVEAKDLLAQLVVEQRVPSNEPPVTFHSYSRTYGEVELLRDQGIVVESEPNANIRRLEQPAITFAAKYRNSNPTLEQIEEILPALLELHDALATAEADGVDVKQAEYATGVLAEACVCVTQASQLSCDSPAGSFVKRVLLELGHYPSPLHDPAYDAEFDKAPSWSGPSPRISAAQGLTNLAHNISCADEELLEAVESVSEDSDPTVRYQVVVRLSGLYQRNPDRMWRIIERIATTDRSLGVLSGLLGYPINAVAGAQPQETASCVQTILERKLSGPGSDEVASVAIGILNGLYVWQEHPFSGELLATFIALPDANSPALHRVLYDLRGWITLGSSDATTVKENAVRARALDVFRRIVRSAKTELNALEEAGGRTNFTSWPEADQEKAKQLGGLLDTAAREYYFASGAFNGGQADQKRERQLLSGERNRFFEESESILNELAPLGFPSIAHNLIQPLESFVQFDPRRVFLTTGQVVRSGTSGGYQFEQMAADLVVHLVERYLAEYRELLQNDEACRKTLVELLDPFITAGWASARRLTHRLGDIYR